MHLVVVGISHKTAPLELREEVTRALELVEERHTGSPFKPASDRKHEASAERPDMAPTS